MSINKVLNHFKKVDSKLYKEAVKADLKKIELRDSNDYFLGLCREIIGQQLAGKVARIIFNRFTELVPRVTPEFILKLSDDDLRNTGMSWSKVSFIKDLASKVKDKSLDLNNLNKLNNKEVAEQLTQVKGIGPWTAEMFLMFNLGREDIFSYGDLGIKKAISNIYKTEDKDKIESISKKWSPYRTYACLTLWKSVD